MSVIRDTAPRSPTAAGFLSVSLLIVLGTILPPSPARAAEPSNSVSLDGGGPQALKQHARVTVETNAAPAGTATNNIAPKEKAFGWQSAWEGWDGLRLEVTRKTLLGQMVSDVTNLHRIHLEETKMAGTMGAKFAFDAAAFVADDAFTGFDNGVELRRARVYAKGDCLLVFPVSYELEIGYIPGSFYIENSYLEFHNLGFLDFLGSLKIGQYQVPMTLVNYGSSRDMTFLESASPLEALAPGVNAGWQIGRPVFSERMTWALGMFTDATGNDFGDATKDFGRVIGRLSGLPLYHSEPGHPESQRLLHLGLSGSVLYAGDSIVRYRSRPESHLAPYVVDTADIGADGACTFGAEAAWVDGPLCLQAELLHSWLRQTNGPIANFGGFYLQASWFLTGESRPYDRSKGTFDRVFPRRNFNFGKGGWGAWELAGRYSQVKLNSAAIEGGRLAMFMAEVNWYLHSHVKWRFNYGFGQVTDHNPDGNLNIFQTRLEVDF